MPLKNTPVFKNFTESFLKIQIAEVMHCYQITAFKQRSSKIWKKKGALAHVGDVIPEGWGIWLTENITRTKMYIDSAL